jgi:thiol-disulfide isomerase/thioredoxin
MNRKTPAPQVLLVAFMTVSILPIPGCMPAPMTATTGTPKKAGRPAKPNSEPRVEILSWDGLQKRRDQFKGKVVVLDVWSTYCTPCVREFPKLVALQEQYPDRVVCISFDTDYSGAKNEPPESFRKPVLDFLTAKHANLLNLISCDPNEEFYDRVKLGGPPAVFVYDQSGTLVKRFDNSHVPKTPEFTYQNDVFPLVQKLLADRK